MIVSAALTTLLIGLWLVGFVVSGIGNLIHLLLVFAVFTAFGVFVGAILLLISVVQKK